MAKGTCSIPDCGKPHCARGLCRKHYYRANPEKPRDRRQQITCSDCGADTLKRIDPRSDPLRCAECARRNMGKKLAALAAEKRDALPPKIKAPKIKAHVTKTCQQCGELFSDDSGHRKFCSTSCLQESHATKMGSRNRKCRDCGCDLGYISLVLLCDDCRVSAKRASNRNSKVTGRSRGAGWAIANNHRKRARAYGVAYESFNRNEVFDRDGWICGICHEPINKRLSFPNMMSVSLDHIVPMFHGGPHTQANSQASHFICNSTKGADMDAETAGLVA